MWQRTPFKGMALRQRLTVVLPAHARNSTAAAASRLQLWVQAIPHISGIVVSQIQDLLLWRALRQVNQ